jgi:hypothetical protein
MPTYHPSYPLRNQALTVKREVWEDCWELWKTWPVHQRSSELFLKAAPSRNYSIQ